MVMNDTNEKLKYISALQCITIDEKTYIADRYDQGLYVIDEKSSNISFVTHLGSKKCNTESEFCIELYYEGKIYFLPQNSYSVVAYDIENNGIIKTYLPYEDGWGFDTVGGFFKDDWLYLFSSMIKYPPIRIRQDLSNIEILNDFWEKMQELSIANELYYMDSFALIASEIIFGMINTNRLYKWSMHDNALCHVLNLSESFQIKKIERCGQNELLVSSRNTNLVAVIDLKSKKVEYHRIKEWRDDVEVTRFVNCGTHLWLVPRYGTVIVKYDISKRMFTELVYDKGGLLDDHLENVRVFYGCNEWEGRLYLYRYGKKGRVVVDLEKGNTSVQLLDKDKTLNWLEIAKNNYFRFIDFSSEVNAVINEGQYDLQACILRLLSE